MDPGCGIKGVDEARNDVMSKYEHVADPATVEACFDAIVYFLVGASVHDVVSTAELRLREIFAPTI